MQYNIQTHFGHRQQHGAVLVVGLMILMIMTTMAVSGASNSLIVEQMASNSQDENISFQIAESASAKALEKPGWVNTALNYLDEPSFTNWQSYDIDFHDSNMNALSTISAYRDIVPGYTINSGSDLIYIRLQIESDATANATERKLTHGYIRIGAGG